MAFESKSIFKLARVYQSSSTGLSFHRHCRLRERESGELKPGEIEDAEIQRLKAHNKKLFATSTKRFFAEESY